jgi:hypothetical protein
VKLEDTVIPENRQLSFRQLLKHWTGLDRAIVFTVMARFWSAMAGVITVLLIARFLTPNEQGYYYTFSSLVALQVVFELGFSFVVLQLAAHECAQLTFFANGRIEGRPVAHSRLASVLKKSVRWYSMASVLMAAVLLPLGFLFFGRHQHPGTVVEWKGQWCFLVIAAMFVFQIDPIFSFLEGCGFISQVAWMRLGQAILGSLLAWGALAMHHGLFAPAMIIVGQVAVGVAFLLASSRQQLLKNLLQYPTDVHRIGWRNEIWPFQWRIAISWISGFFIYQLVNPILFVYQGPVAAGRMGMSLNISGAIAAVAIAWMSTKASPFGSLVARREFAELDKLFFRTCWQSTVLLVIGDATFLMVLIIAGHDFPNLAMRVLTPWIFALMMLTTLQTHIAFCQALYLRSHKQEPFLWITVIGAILIGSTDLVVGRLWGVNSVVACNCALSIIYGLPAGTYIFITKRREWHHEPVRKNSELTG